MPTNQRINQSHGGVYDVNSMARSQALNTWGGPTAYRESTCENSRPIRQPCTHTHDFSSLLTLHSPFLFLLLWACSTAHRSNRPDHWDGLTIHYVSPAGNRCHFVLLDEKESCPTADRYNIRPSHGPGYWTCEAVPWSRLLDLWAVEHAPELQMVRQIKKDNRQSQNAQKNYIKIDSSRLLNKPLIGVQIVTPRSMNPKIETH